MLELLLVPISVLVLLNIITVITASIIIFHFVKSKRKIGSELEKAKIKAKEPQLHAMYEELDYIQMHTAADCSKIISIKDNVSYSTKETVVDKKAAHSEVPL